MGGLSCRQVKVGWAERAGGMDSHESASANCQLYHPEASSIFFLHICHVNNSKFCKRQRFQSKMFFQIEARLG